MANAGRSGILRAMRARIGQGACLPAGLLAALLAIAGCAGPSATDAPPAPSSTDAPPAPSEAPMLVQPRIHHDAMRDRAEAYCAQFGGAPELVDWRYRSTFGKRGEWRLETMWECHEAAE